MNGSPVDQLSTAALANGIIIETPAPVRVRVGGDMKTLHARIKRWYETKLVSTTAGKYKEIFDVTKEAKLGYYMATAQDEKASGKKEDVKGSLEAMLSPAGFQEAVDRAELILSSAEVVLTDVDIEKASVSPSSIGDNEGKSKSSVMFDLDIRVNDDGRLRLWKYSKMHPHDQLLLVSNGVAIAAPRIRQELMTHDLTIVQMPDEGLVRQAVDTINNKK